MTDFIGEIERDAITELLNIAIGRAAAGLSLLVEDEVHLSVPRVDFLTPAQAAERMEADTKGQEAVAVKQHFSGPFSGDILLLFPEQRSLDLVRHMLGDDVPLSQLTELEQEALMEVGNVILNSCLGSLVNQLGLSVESSLPAYLRGHGNRLLADEATRGASSADDGLAMFLHVDFCLKSKDISGFLAFVMDIASAKSFVISVQSYLDQRL